MAKVLYVDHNLERVVAVKDVLYERFNLEIALNCWEGLAAAMLYTPDLVLMNLTTPVMDGIEAIRLMRTEQGLRNLPVIGFTVPRHEEIEKVAVEKGCSLILHYPFEESQLVEVIHAHLPPAPEESGPARQISG